jgi:7-cyano-7-deazaguanine synthase
MHSVVLFSGGLDSAVLLALERRDHATVWPLYVRAGLAWETAELGVARTLLALPPFAGRVQGLRVLDADMRDLYPPTHWALTGQPPGYDTPDEDVYLPGRNLLLIAKAAVLCQQLGASRLALGLLAGNPFPDATPQFFEAVSRAATLALDHPLDVATPLASMHKDDVVRLGRELGVPIDRTVSCMNPQAHGTACGRCSKCRERDQALATTATG